MAERIHIELGTLRDLAAALAKLSSEFHGVGERVDDAQSVVGSSDVKDALYDFGSNWKIHRGRLIESIDAVQAMASESEEKFSELDRDLANQILGDA